MLKDFAREGTVVSSASYANLDNAHYPIMSDEKDSQWPGTCWAST